LRCREEIKKKKLVIKKHISLDKQHSALGCIQGDWNTFCHWDGWGKCPKKLDFTLDRL